MKNNWKSKKIGEISIIEYGYTEKTSFEKIGPKFLRITDIQNGNVNWSSVPYCRCNGNDFLKYKLVDNDIVFVRTGATTGKSYLIKNPPESVFASYLIRLQILNKNFILPEFLYYFFHTDEYWNAINKGLSGSAQGGFNATKVGLLNFSFPESIEEQKRIVSKLDDAFEKIGKAKQNAAKNVQNAHEVFESYLENLFINSRKGWQTKKLGEVCKFQGGSQPPKTVFSKIKEEGYVRLIQIRDYKSDKHLVYIPIQEAKRFCDVDDVMIGRYGPPLFQILRGIKGSYNVALIKVIPNKELTKEFLYYFLKNNRIRNYIISLSARAAGQIGLNKETIEPYPISYPSISEQGKIVDDLNALSKQSKILENKYQQKLSLLEELKKSILHKAFSGEL